MSLAGRTLFITGASRGIGLAIALKAARQGANIAIAAKTSTPNPKLPGTIYTAADEIEKAGGQALPLAVDVREETMVRNAIAKTVSHFGRLDIVVNNASAISLSTVEHTEMRRYDLMQQVNARGAFLVSKYAIPHLMRGENPHILMISPPLDMQEKWFAPATAYAMAKFGMSLVALGLAGELRPKAIAVNTLWPRTTIATSAIKNLLGGDRMMRRSRSPEIMAEAACRIFQKPAYIFSGNFLIDDSFLAAEGVTDFDQYRIDPSQALAVDFFVPAEPPPPKSVSLEPVAGSPAPAMTDDDERAEGEADRAPEHSLMSGSEITEGSEAIRAAAETGAGDLGAETAAHDDAADNADDAVGAHTAAMPQADEADDDGHDDLDNDHDDGEEDDRDEDDAHDDRHVPTTVEIELDAALAAAVKEMSFDLSEEKSDASKADSADEAPEASPDEETDPTLRALEQQLLGPRRRRS